MLLVRALIVLAVCESSIVRMQRELAFTGHRNTSIKSHHVGCALILQDLLVRKETKH